MNSFGDLKLNSKCHQQFRCLSWKNILLLVQLHVQIVMWHSIKLKARIHVATMCAVVKFRRLSTPEFVVRNIAHNVAAIVVFRPISVTLRAINLFVYPPSATFRANF